jgi:sterol desaturase/sphingolipid hydroxylase (fatty acid hydroxylase superfamily)
MQNVFDQSDGLIRLGVFAGVFLVMALVEFAWPKRTLVASKGRRWLTNLGISVTANVVLRAMAALAVPIAAIDLAIWAQHLVSHKVPILWRLHKVHHADRDIDVTTAVRFHPFEIALSMLWKIVVVVPLGASPFAVFLFEVILNGCAMFNHANVALPAWLDRTLRLFIVTPDMHRVHHSVLRREHDSNYGFNLSLWDRLFRTYTAQPEGGHQRMKIGLTPYQSEDPSRFGWSLLLPFWPGGGNTATTEVSKEQLQGGAKLI